MQQLKIDKKDEKILTELTLNSRIPINQLAKKVGISREVATYRLNKLINEKIILGFYTSIDSEALGFQRYGCFFRLKGISKTEEEKFIEHLIRNEFVSYLSPIIGKWNVVFDIYAKDKEHLKQIVSAITEKIEKYLDKYIVISLESELESFPAKIFGSAKEIEYKKSKKIELDKTDLKILRLLSDNSRIEYSELAKKLNLSANAIKYRIKNLEHSGIIKGYTISVDYKKVNYEFYNIQLKTPGKKELKNFLRNNKHVIYFYKYIGNENWDYDSGLIVKNSLELREFILELKENFPETEINEIYLVVEELKGDYAPEGIFKGKS